MSKHTPATEDTDPKPRTRVAGPLLTLAVWLLVLLLIVIAVGASGARYLARNINDFRPGIESLLSERLGQDVTIGALSARWQGPDPLLQVRDIEVAHKDHEDARAVALQHLLLRLDGPRSLRRMGLVFQRVEADGLDLVVSRKDDGGMAIEGLNQTEAGPGLPGAYGFSGKEWLQPQRWLNELAGRISDPEVRLTHLTLGLRTPHSQTLFVDIPQLDLTYDGGSVSASGRAMRQGTLEQLATFSIQGSDPFDGHFSGQIWADITSGGLLEAITRGLEWGNFRLQELNASASTWLTFVDGRLQRLNGRIDVPRLNLGNDLATLPVVEDLNAQVGWRRTEEGGSLHVRGMQWRWQQEVVEGLAVKLEYDRRRYQVEAADIPMGPLVRLAVASNLLPARAEPEVAGLRPEGQLSSLHLTVPRDDPMDFEMLLKLDGASIEPHRGAPGGDNLKGQVWLNRHGGRVRAKGEDMVLLAPDIYAEPLTFSQVEGEVAWREDGGITRVFSRDLRATYAGLTQVNGGFDLRLDRYGEDNLGLRIELANARASMLPAVLPSRLLDKELYDWLTTAITQGELVSGKFYGHGQIDASRSPNSFSTAMEYRFRDASITYDPSWPEVTGASGQVTIHNSDARVVLDSATTGGVQLGKGEVELVQGEVSPIVKVATGARIKGEQARYWLTQTPLVHSTGGAGQVVSLAGDYNLDLALAVPLIATDNVEVNARLETTNGSLLHAPSKLRWQEIAGSLSYSNRSGFSGDALSARFLGQPVRVSFQADPKRGALTIVQSGEADVSSVARALMPQALPGLSGQLPYTAELNFLPDADVLLSVTAKTSGLNSDWPDPLGGGKPKPDEVVEALLRWPDGDQVLLEARWGDRLFAALEWQGESFRGGQVVIGDGSARFPVEDGLMIRAAFDRFAPAQWQSLLGQLGVVDSSSANEVSETGRRIDWLNSIDLRMSKLVLGDNVFPGVRLIARPQTDGWLLTTDSERAAGRVRIPYRGDRIWVDFDHLRLAKEGVVDESDPVLLTASGQLEEFQRMAAGRWPEVEVRIKSLVMGGSPAGSWSFVLSPSSDQVTLMDLQGRLESLVFDGQLRWGVTSGEQVTVVQGVLEGGGLQGLAGLLGHDMPLTNEGSVVDMHIAWPGRPDQFVAGRLNGEFSLRLDDGIILENNQTAQLFRMFNLLNTDTLRRRLQFDFSDLYEAGVAFDALYGKAELDQGILTWNPDLQLAGPSGALRLSGSTNLADKQLDMRLVVILPLTQNLPLAAILMGASPPVGGALFVLDKLLGEPLSKLTSATYSVKGAWDDPDVKLRNIFDSGNRE